MKRITTNTVMIKDSESGDFRSFPAFISGTDTPSGSPGQVWTSTQDGNAEFVYPTVIDVTMLDGNYYKQSMNAQNFYIDIQAPILSRFALPSKTTNVYIYNGENVLNRYGVSTPNEIEVRFVSSSNVTYICKYISGLIRRYDYNVAENTLSITSYDILPIVTTDDDGKILQVTNGRWKAIAITNGNEVSY